MRGLYIFFRLQKQSNKRQFTGARNLEKKKIYLEFLPTGENRLLLSCVFSIWQISVIMLILGSFSAFPAYHLWLLSYKCLRSESECLARFRVNALFDLFCALFISFGVFFCRQEKCPRKVEASCPSLPSCHAECVWMTLIKRPNVIILLWVVSLKAHIQFQLCLYEVLCAYIKSIVPLCLCVFRGDILWKEKMSSRADTFRALL